MCNTLTFKTKNITEAKPFEGAWLSKVTCGLGLC